MRHHLRISHRLWWAGILVAILLPATAFAAAGGVGQWSVAGHDLDNSRNASTEHEISTLNVASLTAKWTFAAPGDVSATPSVDAGSVYFPDWAGYLHRVDAETGQEIWATSIGDYIGIPGAVSRDTPAVVGNTLYVGTQQGAWLLAINRQNGDLLWKTQLDPHPAATITSSPVVHAGRVYVGIASSEEFAAANPAYPCCTFRGSLVIVDASSGGILHQTYTVPDGYSGGAIWGSLAVDVQRGLVYANSGNNYSIPASVQACLTASPNDASCVSPDNMIDAVVAFDATTGAVRWAHSALVNDTWTLACLFGMPTCPDTSSPDFDFGSGPQLLHVRPTHGKPYDLVGAGQKSGKYWTFNPDTGAVVWVTQVGPGSALGGIQWGSAADGTRVYAAISNFPGPGSISALDPATGAILWQTADPHGGADMGAVSVANGVVYAGAVVPGGSGAMYALDATSGQILWEQDTPGAAVGGPAIANGTVFWGNGYAHLGLALPGNALFAFSTK